MNGRADEPNIFRTIGDILRRLRILEFAVTAPTGTATGRILAGALYNDANIIEGTGFTAEWNDEDSSHPGENLYTIRFAVPFSEPGPVVALAANNNNPVAVAGEYGVSLKTRNADYIVVETTDFDGAAGDGGFDFVAIEASA